MGLALDKVLMGCKKELKQKLERILRKKQKVRDNDLIGGGSARNIENYSVNVDDESVPYG